jgi:lysyl-tRNA synthetase, class I
MAQESSETHLDAHWAEQLAGEVITKKNPPFVVSSGMTTSGPPHLGTLCELLYPAKICQMLVSKEAPVSFYFMVDILDAFDSIPMEMEKYRAQLEPHFGKPLAHVPDPTGKSSSFGGHYLSEVEGIARMFGIKAEIVRIDALYASGRPDPYAEFFLENAAQSKEIVERTSGKQEKKGWAPIMPICEKCGRIATTSLTGYDKATKAYTYSCDRDAKYVKGCGNTGTAKISDHKYKLTWRLHWPMWQDLFGTSCEGAGVDHFTKGGSRDTLEVVFREMFKKEPPIGYRYGFVMLDGKKYSKSKGIGMGLTDLIRLVPVEVISFALIRPDIGENKDIGASKETVMKMVEEYEAAYGYSQKKPGDMDRAEEKRVLAYRLAGQKRWSCLFRDALMANSIYGKLAGAKGMDAGDAEYLQPFMDEWSRRGLIPDDYNFTYAPKRAEGHARSILEGLTADMSAEEVHNAIFEYAKSNSLPPKEMFKALYMTLIGKERGPRLGSLIYSLGVARVRIDTLQPVV